MPRFDVVIVGGGSAGNVLAGRLSEGGRKSVLLLEAGKDWRSADAPAEIRSLNFFQAFQRPEFFWTELKGRLSVRDRVDSQLQQALSSAWNVNLSEYQSDFTLVGQDPVFQSF